MDDSLMAWDGTYDELVEWAEEAQGVVVEEREKTEDEERITIAHKVADPKGVHGPKKIEHLDIETWLNEKGRIDTEFYRKP